MDKNLHELLDELELHTRRKHPERSNDDHAVARRMIEDYLRRRFRRTLDDTKLDGLPNKKAS